MRSLKKLYQKFDNFLCNNDLIRRVIYFQHQILPLPLPVFDFIFRSKTRRLLFNSYGSHIFRYSYLARKRDNYDYWISRDSLYWHFWRQSDTNQEQLRKILSIVSLQSLNIVEIGFGIGRNYKILQKEKPRHYVAVEPNKHLCDYVAKNFRNLEVVCQPLKDFAPREFDVLIATNGVFMYLDKKTVDHFFSSLKIKVAIFLNEGSPNGDVLREDNTTMYDFKSRLMNAGYGNKRFLQKVRNTGIYDYLVMY